MATSTFDQLTYRCAQIVELRCRRDLSHKEIARELGISAHTVKNHTMVILRTLAGKSMTGICFDYGQSVTRKEQES